MQPITRVKRPQTTLLMFLKLDFILLKIAHATTKIAIQIIYS